MTHTPEPDEPDERGPSPGDQGAGRKVDEDAVWREIVANYGDRAQPDPGGADPVDDTQPETPRATRGERLRGLFRPAWSDPLDSEASWDDEGHFVPPDPPPPPRPEPRRRAAWIGLFGAPSLMLLAVVLGWALPSWLTAGLAACFVGGFVYLVATMPQRPGDGDDGAVV